MTTDTPTADPGPLPSGTRIGRTALRVTDREAVTAFYRDVVGLDVLEERASTTVLGAGETPLVVLEADPDAPERPASSAGLFHTAIRVPSRAALGDALARIRDGWRLGGASDHLVSEALYLTDPEGNGVEIYRDRPRSEWDRDDDGHVRLPTDPLELAPIEAAATGATRVPAGTDIGHVHLETTDLAAFREYYVDTLGFEVQATVPEAVFVSAGGYHHHVAANTWHHRTAPRDGRGLVWFELLVPDRAALEDVRARLTAHERPVRELDDGLELTDPDGITIRLRPQAPDTG